jgi:aryl-alcohol dehydrogenase-like predicted oxidoreductase
LFNREQAYDVVDKLNELARKYNTSTTAVPVAWLLSKQVVSTVIIGVSKLEQLRSNLDASDLSFLN